MKVTYYVALQHYDFQGICGAKFTFANHAEFLPPATTKICLTQIIHTLGLRVSESWWYPTTGEGEVIMDGQEYFTDDGKPDEDTAESFIADMRVLELAGWTLLTVQSEKPTPRLRIVTDSK